MARPERNNVDYFPFLCKEGKAMYYIEHKYGNDGYASWVKILRQLAVTNYHYLNLTDKVEFMYLASKCKVSENTLTEMINDLCSLGEFHAELWHENMIIYSEKFVDSIKDAYLKRNNKCISLEGLFLLLSDLGIRKLSKGKGKGADNPQRREEKSKEEKKREFILPEYEAVFNKWLTYKANRRESYKDEESIELAYKKLIRLSHENPENARLIVDESMSNNWAGIFELKNSASEDVSSKPKMKY